MAVILIGFGLGLAGLGLVVQKLAPAGERAAFLAGIGGGGLSLLWGVAALAGWKGRRWAILSMTATVLVLLTRAVHGWTTATGVEAELALRVIVTLMFGLTMGMLLYLFHGERPPEFYKRERGEGSGRGE